MRLCKAGIFCFNWGGPLTSEGDADNKSAEAAIPAISAEQALLAGTKEGLRGLVLAGRYQILEKIGSGGWGTVYKGKHLTLESFVAIKLLHSHLAEQKGIRKRFENEANILTRIDSQYVVKTIDLIFEPVPYIVMDFFPGTPLGKVLESRKRLEFPVAVELFRQICEGLQVAHDAGLVHRDLKPANILVELSGDSLKSKILDFGIAKILDEGEQEKLTSTGEVLGSPPYMAPEQWAGRGVDQRTDIYSLGCIMYEVICGRQAFIAEYGLDYLNKHLHADPPSFESVLGKAAKGIPPQFELLVRKCMAKTQERRYASASDILKDLNLLKAGKKIQIRDEGAAKKRLRSLVLFGSAAMILFGTAAAGWLQRENIITAYCKKLNGEADLLRKDPKKEAQAEEKYRNVISLSIYLANAQDKNKLHAMHSLVSLLKLQNRFEEYTELNKQVMKVIGENQAPAAEKLALFVRSYSGRNIYSAEQTERQLVDQIAKQVGSHSIDYAIGLTMLSQCKRAEGDYKSATQYGQDSLKIFEDLLEPDDPKIAAQLLLLGIVMRESKQTKESERLFLRLVDIAQKTCPEQLAGAYNLLGVLCLDQKQVDKAVDYFHLATKTYAIHNDMAGNVSYENNLALAFEDQGKLKQSLQTFKQVLEIEESKGRTNSGEYYNSLFGMARVCLKSQRYAESERYMLRAIEVKKQGCPYGPPLSELYGNMYYLCLQQGKEKEGQLFKKLAQSASAAPAVDNSQFSRPRKYLSGEQEKYFQ